ncbi:MULTISPECIES: hypothetical protein [Pseudomonas]|uniref:Uncharacterized protein n=1 Tax=Pseudomonas entomophila TaxID=312306 RepID=A0A3Q8TXP2_9PSED|nr:MULTISPECIES: hypothetical protein [Pseudomonas]AZL66537.1 hypothetical protein EJA05_01740 [Pseudomonas oryziphila]UVL89674.1 hypothetical protein LOY51_01825 [Pseudomonas sichuanensis]
MEDLDLSWFGLPVQDPEFKKVLMTYREGNETRLGSAEVSLTYSPDEEPRLDIMPRDPESAGKSSSSTKTRQNPADFVSVAFGDRDGDGLAEVPEKLKTFISSLIVGDIIKYNGDWIEIINKHYHYETPNPVIPSGYIEIQVKYRKFTSV